MQCDICQRPWTTKLLFNCPTCACNTLYEARVEQAYILLEKEASGKQVAQVVEDSNPGNLGGSPSNNRSAKRYTYLHVDSIVSAKDDATDKTQAALADAKILREERETIRLDIAKRRAHLNGWRSELASADRKLSIQSGSALDPVIKNIGSIESQWNALHAETVKSRAFLCKTAANLYGLQQRKRKRGTLGRDIYMIGGVPITDLRDLNNAVPTQVTASLTSLSYLLLLVSHYLSLRLPAEITLPHRDYPLPTIFSPSSSYLHRDVAFPGSTAHGSSSNSPSASKMEHSGPLPRPRPLYLEKPLSVLAKEDTVAYSYFVEGVTLLAWDVAWVCRTQGLNVAAGSWEDICSMGKNLWQLLLAPIPSYVAPKVTVATEAPMRTSPLRNETSHLTADKEAYPLLPLGHFSHGTAHSFLEAADGAAHMRGWRHQNPLRLIEKVKNLLLSDRTGAEWEILEGNEWEEEDTASTLAEAARRVEETTKAREPNEIFSGELHQLVSSRKDDETTFTPRDATDAGEDKNKGTSGWTKLKNRGTNGMDET